ncbi:unnamed protein product [Symbiodinium natans]|uniref:Uncharacterized protein n=1 Tax=Symbiodinium natans TaxID=878477 RepID=A0A812SYU8_9DINO|nr:unnamed protein product [Symbiodinium natans]
MLAKGLCLVLAWPVMSTAQFEWVIRDLFNSSDCSSGTRTRSYVMGQVGACQDSKTIAIVDRMPVPGRTVEIESHANPDCTDPQDMAIHWTDHCGAEQSGVTTEKVTLVTAHSISFAYYMDQDCNTTAENTSVYPLEVCATTDSMAGYGSFKYVCQGDVLAMCYYSGLSCSLDPSCVVQPALDSCTGSYKVAMQGSNASLCPSTTTTTTTTTLEVQVGSAAVAFFNSGLLILSFFGLIAS